MFIKLHTYTPEYVDGKYQMKKGTEKEYYYNTDNIVYIAQEEGVGRVGINGGEMFIKEPVDDIMKIIGYFKVANDK